MSESLNLEIPGFYLGIIIGFVAATLLVGGTLTYFLWPHIRQRASNPVYSYPELDEIGHQLYVAVALAEIYRDCLRGTDAEWNGSICAPGLVIGAKLRKLFGYNPDQIHNMVIEAIHESPDPTEPKC